MDDEDSEGEANRDMERSSGLSAKVTRVWKNKKTLFSKSRLTKCKTKAKTIKMICAYLEEPGDR